LKVKTFQHFKIIFIRRILVNIKDILMDKNEPKLWELILMLSLLLFGYLIFDRHLNLSRTKARTISVIISFSTIICSRIIRALIKNKTN